MFLVLRLQYLKNPHYQNGISKYGNNAAEITKQKENKMKSLLSLAREYDCRGHSAPSSSGFR